MPTDFVAPSTAALARIPDARAAQYWDRKRALSHLLGEHNRSTVVWDYIAVYAPGTLWQDALPKPPILSRAKKDVGKKLGSAAMKADAKQTDFCVICQAFCWQVWFSTRF